MTVWPGTDGSRDSEVRCIDLMSADVPSWPALLEQLLQGEALSAAQSTQLMQAWLAEELTPVQTGGFLAGLRAKGMVANELAALSVRQGIPVAFGLLTVNDLDQAKARSGGARGNKGEECMNAALAAAAVAARLRAGGDS